MKTIIEEKLVSINHFNFMMLLMMVGQRCTVVVGRQVAWTIGWSYQNHFLFHLSCDHAGFLSKYVGLKETQEQQHEKHQEQAPSEVTKENDEFKKTILKNNYLI